MIQSARQCTRWGTDPVGVAEQVDGPVGVAMNPRQADEPLGMAVYSRQVVQR